MIDQVPQFMKDQKQWLLWEFQPVIDEKTGKQKIDKDTGKPKFTKVPTHPIGKYEVSAQKISAYQTYEEILKLTVKDKYFTGFAINPKCSDMVFIDLDKIKTKEQQKIADAIIKKFNSYTEISPSGNGYHIYVRGTKKTGDCTNKKTLEIEYYSHGRFATVTGDTTNNLPVIENQEAIDWFEAKFFPKKEKKTVNIIPSPVTSTDQEILDRAFNASNGLKIRSLYEGDTSAHGDDASSADMALACHLAFYTRDSQQIENIMRSSALLRKKWNDHPTYLQEFTITRALETVTETYTPPEEIKPFDTTKPNPFDDTELTFQEIMDLPDRGNVYLADGLIPKGCTIISAPPKSMKSFLMLHLADCLVTENKLFGHFDIEKNQRILLLDRENEPYMIQRRLKKLKVPGNNLITYNNSRETLKKSENREALFAYLRKTRPTIIVIDSMVRFLDGDENSSEMVSTFFNQVITPIKDMNISVIIIHHNNKNPDAKGANKMRGSTDFSAYPDCSIQVSMRKLKGRPVLSITQTDNRHDESLDKFGVEVISEPEHLRFSYLSNIQIENDKVELAKLAIKKFFVLKKNLTRESREDKNYQHYFKDVGYNAFNNALKVLVDEDVIEMTKDGRKHVYNLV